MASKLPDVVSDGLRVLVWRNLHHPGHAWSVREVGAARVGFLVSELFLTGVEFRVQPAGQARARRTGHRNVHASAVGVAGAGVGTGDRGWLAVSYTPFGPAGFFLVSDARRTVVGCEVARFDQTGLHVQGPRFL